MTEDFAPLERLLARRADDAYRLAVLLTLDPRRAAAALTAAVSSLRGAAVTDEAALLRALLRAAPRAARFRQAAQWAHPADPSERALLRALPQLTARERLTLALGLLRPTEPDLLAAVLDLPAAEAHAALGAALLSTAQHTDLPAAQAVAAQFSDPPPACAETRAALLAGNAATLPLVRGHLALCDACRAAEAALTALTEQLTATLGHALAPHALPEPLAAQLRAALRPASRSVGGLWLLLLPLGVLLLGLLLWLPARPASVAVTSLPTETAADPHALVTRAAARLYAPPTNSAVWHGRWQIYWPFDDGSATTLNADLWQSPGQHRAQLVHPAGGAPYEFELANGNDVFYNISRGYAPSIYPQLFSEPANGVRFSASQTETQQLLKARLDSGAWGLAARYLELAAAAPDLRAWGRRTEDGNTVKLVGFQTFSPLGRVPDPSDAPNVTALLAFDANSGELREISELIGRSGGEQTGRTVWRFASWEQVAPSEPTFDLRQAWNGRGGFVPLSRLIAPRLPLIQPRTTIPPERALRDPGVILPAPPPPGVDAAVLIAGRRSDPTVVVYTGPGRYLAVLSGTPISTTVLTCSVPESVRLSNNQTAQLCARPNQLVLGQVSLNPEFFNGSIRFSGDQIAYVGVAARGFSRTELLTIFDNLTILNAERLADQRKLFAQQLSGSLSAQELIEGALDANEPPPHTARALVIAMHSRQRRFEGSANPYARPPYGGIASDTRIESWTRPHGGVIERASRSTDATQLIQIDYADGRVTSLYDAPLRAQYLYDQVSFFDGMQDNGMQDLLRTVLSCSGLELTAQADQLVVSLTEPDWLRYSCVRPNYRDSYHEQQSLPYDPSQQYGPFIADLIPDPDHLPPLTTVIRFRLDHSLLAAEVHLGSGPDAPLIERWELISDQYIGVDQIPIELFSAERRPDALLVYDFRAGSGADLPMNAPQVVPLPEAKAQATTPFFWIDQDRIAQLVQIERVVPQTNDARGSVSSDTPIDAAVAHGFASRSVYQLTDQSAGATLFEIVQGPVDRFGAFLHTNATWAEQTPFFWFVGDEQINGWQVRDLASRHTWLLFERDGTLLAVMVDTDPQRTAMHALVRA